MIIQFCGLSGSGKSTLAQRVKEYFLESGLKIEIIDGDEYRNVLWKDLGFTKEDRCTNIRRLAFIAGKFAQYDIIPIICAINPYDAIRREVTLTYPSVKTIYIKCDIKELIRRDTKGLYKRAMLPDENEDKIINLSGINDPFEIPFYPDLIIETDKESVEDSLHKLTLFIKENNQRIEIQK